MYIFSFLYSLPTYSSIIFTYFDYTSLKSEDNVNKLERVFFQYIPLSFVSYFIDFIQLEAGCKFNIKSLEKQSLVILNLKKKRVSQNNN